MTREEGVFGRKLPRFIPGERTAAEWSAQHLPNPAAPMTGDYRGKRRFGVDALTRESEKSVVSSGGW
jgi:hypothetical protein